MKKTFICLLSLIVGSQLKAQNIGIGTTNPTSKLHVVGNIRSTARIDADGVIEGAGVSSTGILFVNQTSLLQGAVTGSSTASFTGTITSNTGFTINDPTAILQLQNAGVNKGFVQLSGDNLRFGTNSGNNNGDVILRMDGTDMIEFGKTGSAGVFMQLNLNGVSAGVLQTTNAGNVSLTAVNANAQVQLGGEVFINNTSSRTGIGTSSPGERLHVNGNMIVNGNAVIDNGRITGTVSGPSYNLLPLAYGRINDNGTKAGGTPNFTSVKVSDGTYEITVTGSTASSVIVATPGNSRVIRARYIGSGVFEIFTRNFSNDPLDSEFHFIIYNP